jgi:geranylgeranyl diphosphate synthase, type II
MHSVSILRTILEGALKDLDFSYEPPELYDPIRYTLKLGGKRIRPLLVLLGCDLFHGKPEDCIKPALAIELFHNFTLLHDDIMDKAPIRRGKETVYKKWNANVAILSGDTMFAIAYDYLTETDPLIMPEILRLFTKTAREVCEGQQYDMNFEKQAAVTIPEYLRMIRLKTAVLLGCSLKLGAILGQASKTDAEKIYEFGVYLGLGFQLQDDLLDVFGEVEKFGKEIGGDIVSNKKTFLYLKALELAGPEEKARLVHYFSSENFPPDEKIKAVKEIYMNLNLEETTHNEIDAFYKKAMDSFEAISVDDQGKKELRLLADQLLLREY